MPYATGAERYTFDSNPTRSSSRSSRCKANKLPPQSTLSHSTPMRPFSPCTPQFSHTPSRDSIHTRCARILHRYCSCMRPEIRLLASRPAALAPTARAFGRDAHAPRLRPQMSDYIAGHASKAHDTVLGRPVRSTVRCTSRSIVALKRRRGAIEALGRERWHGREGGRVAAQLALLGRERTEAAVRV